MKRYTKIITLILSCLLLIGSAVGIAVAASDAPDVAIAKKNIAYEGAPKILYAVTASGKNDGDTVKIIFSDSAEIEAPTVGAALDEAAYTTETSYVKAENASDITIAGTAYDLVYSKGVAPSNMRKPIYAMPVLTDADGVVRASGEVVEYSVYIYATNKFEAGATEDQKVLFSSLLDYGASVQRVLAESDSDVVAAIDAYGYADAYYGYNMVVTLDGAAVTEPEKVRGLTAEEYITAEQLYTADSAYAVFCGFTDKDGNAFGEYGAEYTASNWTRLPAGALGAGAYEALNVNYVSDDVEYLTFDTAPTVYNSSTALGNISTVVTDVCQIGTKYYKAAGKVWCTVDGSTYTEVAEGTEGAVECVKYYATASTSTASYDLYTNVSAYVEDVTIKNKGYALASELDGENVFSYGKQIVADKDIGALKAGTVLPAELVVREGGTFAFYNEVENPYAAFGGNGVVHVFETDFWFYDPVYNSASVQAWIECGSSISSNNNHMWGFKFVGNQATTFSIGVDGTSGECDDVGNDNIAKGLLQREWYKLRIEYYDLNDTEMLVKVYIDGKLYAEFDNPYNDTETVFSNDSGFLGVKFNSVYDARNFQMYFDNTYLTTLGIEEYLGKGSNVEKAEGYEDVAAASDLPSNFTVNKFTTSKTDSTASYTAIEEENGNKYMSVGRNAAENQDTITARFNFDKPSAVSASTWEYYSYVFETDFRWNGAGENGTGEVASAFLNINWNGTQAQRPFLYQDADGNLQLRVAQTGAVKALLLQGHWYNMKIEIVPISETEFRTCWYINDTLIYTFGDYTGDPSLVTGVNFQFRTYDVAAGNDFVDVSFDNTYCATLYEDYLGQGVYASQAEAFEDGSFTGTANGQSAVTVSSDKLTTKLYAWNRTNGDVWSKVVTDGENSYLDTGRNNSDSSLSSEFYFDDAELTESYKYVFETDIKWGGSGQEPIANQPMFFNIYFGTTRTTSVRPALYQDADGNLLIKSHQAGNATLYSTLVGDCWYNLRIEFIQNATDSTTFDMYMYVNNTEVMSSTGLALVNGSTTGTFADISKIMFEVRGSSHCAGNNYFNISFDNTFCSRVAVAAE